MSRRLEARPHSRSRQKAQRKGRRIRAAFTSFGWLALSGGREWGVGCLGGGKRGAALLKGVGVLNLDREVSQIPGEGAGVRIGVFANDDEKPPSETLSPLQGGSIYGKIQYFP